MKIIAVNVINIYTNMHKTPFLILRNNKLLRHFRTDLTCEIDIKPQPRLASSFGCKEIIHIDSADLSSSISSRR